MPRIRTVKPEHWGDKELPKISIQAHLLWIGMWNFSDDKGVIENDPYYIKSQVFPRRKDVRVEQIEQWIDQLIKARFLVPFIHNGISYYVSRTFSIHQKIDRPTPSKIPQSVINELLIEGSIMTQRRLDESTTKARSVEYSRVEESRVEESIDFTLAGSDEPDTKKIDNLNLSAEEVSFKKFQVWLTEKASSVSKMKEPFTLDQFLKLKEQVGPSVIQEMCLRMHNWADLVKKNKSAYLTFINWHNRAASKTK